jgi:hypothetical protein
LHNFRKAETTWPIARPQALINQDKRYGKILLRGTEREVERKREREREGEREREAEREGEREAEREAD